MYKGYVSLILHAHLPYVRHPEYENYLEENWYYEAITECYIPLLNVFESLKNDNIDFKITMTLTPTLLSLMSDNLIKQRYLKYLERLIDLSEREVVRTGKYEPHFNPIAKMYESRLKETYYSYFDKYNCDLVKAFRKFMDSGNLEVLASAATHGLLPFITLHPEALYAQIKVGADTYRRFFNREPDGFWLPECAYISDVDKILRNEGIKYTIVETHGLIYGTPRPKHGSFSPIITPEGIAVFGRDIESSKQVWSATEGYPGDFDYREYYRDIGFDLDMDYIRSYIHSDGIRINTGIKYFKITGKGDYKEPYDRNAALEKAAIHAGNFMFNRELQIKYVSGGMDRPPIIICPYDAELFGHWWFEGPDWLNFLFRKAEYDQQTFKFITPSEYLEMYPENQVSSPTTSSWGNKGYFEVWLNQTNDWIYRHLHKAAERMIELANLYPYADGIKRDALNQASRELLLAQSSDWAFIMDSGTMVEYAVNRTKLHLNRFTRLYEEIKDDRIDTDWIRFLQQTDNIFPDIDYSVYQSATHPLCL
ncbi:MAG TPA: DUF1957 domain-containing protein [Thermoanaerobacterales bacterium]|nr:DUF1957 domain-containing protein [Thermoanaerobacterales bacterium]